MKEISDKKRNNILYHNQRVHAYDESISVNFQWEIIEELYGFKKWAKELKKTPKIKLILDVGAGTGKASIPIAAMNAKWTAICIDISLKMLQTAKEKSEKHGLKNMQFVIADAENLPFKSDVFDAIITNGCLHHLPKVFKCLTEIKRIIKVGGKYHANEPNSRRIFLFKIEYFIKTIVKKLLKRPSNTTHTFERPLDPLQIKTELESLNMEVELSTHCFLPFAKFFPYSFVYHFICLDDLINRTFLRNRGEILIINSELKG